MEEFVEELMEELDVQTAFTLPILGGIEIKESIVGCWAVMGVLILIAIILGSNLKVNNISKRQAFAEMIVTKCNEIVGGMLGEEAKKYTPFMASIMVFIGAMNIAGMFGIKPPTKDLNVTIALAFVSIVTVQVAGIRAKGVGGWIKSFFSPVWIVFPINVMEIGIKPLSLCLRLFGNILGAFIIMKMVELLIPIVVPVVFSLYFDIFDGFLQAYVFTFLSSMYIKEAVEMAEE
ncbi:MAG: F0F1 ATP synthase subunit A [Lachnospiraceae bacterium]|nr:F0F1 ATP synthase subunit A [Lachnospiraceae bacterium]